MNSSKKINVPDKLQAAKDWLIISCYTGQRVSDFMNFSKEMIQNVHNKLCIYFTQQKTQKTVLLPLHPVVKEIISKNAFNFPKKITPQRYNEQIKEVAKLANVVQSINTRKRNGFRASLTSIPKWEAISSHIGRRSFATNFYGKIPTPLLMQATGHSSEQMFQRYISNIDTERTYNLSLYFEEIYESRLASGSHE